MSGENDGVILHGYAVKCPECGAALPVPVTVNITPPDDEGLQHPTFETDYTDIWAHNLTHPPGRDA